MPVHYRRLPAALSRDRELVSTPWYWLLTRLHKSGVHYNVNEGKRTLARQAQLVREKGLWSSRNPTGAAAPSRTAPHIREGRFDHAIDFDNAAAVVAAAAKLGVRLNRPISTEPWHVEADRTSLLRAYRKAQAAVLKARAKKAAAAAKAKAKAAAAKAKAAVIRRKPATKVSAKGAEFIAGFEGFVGHPYRDVVGVWTIGFGHTAAVGPRTKPITRTQALALLRADLDRVYTPPVVRAAKAAGIQLTQNELDALVSAVYNLGPGVLDRGRTLGDALRSKSRKRIADAFLPYDKAGSPPRALAGLTRRRHAERALFLKK